MGKTEVFVQKTDISGPTDHVYTTSSESETVNPCVLSLDNLAFALSGSSKFP